MYLLIRPNSLIYGSLHNSFDGDPYTIVDFKIKFKVKYPEIFDVYQFEKKSKFDVFIENSIKTFAKKKINHNYSIQISFKKSSDLLICENIDLEYENSKELSDKLIIDNQKIIINCYRSSKINLNNIIFSDKNNIHNQIIKALIYYYVQLDTFIEIEKLEIIRISETNKEVVFKLPSKNISLDQILNNNFQGISIDVNSIKNLFNKDEKSEALKYSLTYLLKAQIDKEPSAKFEKLWKSLNSIYRHIGNGANENECHRILRRYILDNSFYFSNTIDLVKNLSIEQLRKNMRISELLQNDYDSVNKVVSFIAFTHRYSDNFILQLLLENLDYQKDYLCSILRMNKMESKFNKFNSIKFIYQDNKSSTDNSVFYKIIQKYLEDSIKNTDSISKIEIVVFTCIKYAYFVRNKIFHAEKQDLTFRLASNNITKELEWINEVLQSLIIDLINHNQNWEITNNP